MTRNRHVRDLLVMAAITLAMLGVAWWAVDNFVPPQDNPFKPLSLTDPPGLATGAKLRALISDPAQCRSLLSEAGVEFTEVDREIDTPECSLDGTLTLDRSLTPYSDTLTMTCPLAAALHVWERTVVIPAAEAELGEPPARIETFGSYSCRKVRGGRSGGWSQHATANAVDISGFSFEDRATIRVLRDYRGDSAESRFLETVRKGACGLFGAVLGPDYNALHRDHFHFDMGGWSTCS
jgi:hypothetical protein